MLERIIKILKSQKDITGYKICETQIQSNELFFIKKNVDMDRAKSVHNFKVTVYVDFEEGDKKLTGSSATNIHPTMSDDEVAQVIKEAAFAAKFVKNPAFPLVTPAAEYQKLSQSAFAEKDFPYWMNEITKAVYQNDIYDKGGINSCEIFLEKIATRVINSEGVDVQDTKYKCMVEFITTWKEEGEEIELYRCLEFSDFDGERIAEEVRNMIVICRDRAVATKTPSLDQFPVILTRDAVGEFFGYYASKSNAVSIYNQSSSWKVGDRLQSTEIKGDLITMSLDPFLENSCHSGGFDSDGYALTPVTIIEQGELKRYSADLRYAHYLDVAATGAIANVVVKGGRQSVEELQQEPHLMVGAFSDFRVNPMTGDFCGEIRLAWYYDGEKTIPVTGGSISGNIGELHQELSLSRELQRDKNFEGPAMIKLNKVTVAGVTE